MLAKVYVEALKDKHYQLNYQKITTLYIAIVTVFFVTSCRQKQTITAKTADREYAEFSESLLARYQEPKDSLKLKMAEFILVNMKGRYHFEGELLDGYLDYGKFVLRDQSKGPYIITQFQKKLGMFSYDRLSLVTDLRTEYLAQMVEEINFSIKIWNEQPWHKNYTFEQFCQYVLPGKIEDERPDYNRAKIYARYSKILDSLKEHGGTAVTACKIINDKLISEGWTMSNRVSYLPHYPASVLLDYRVGTCREMADLATHVMRAVGIPVAQDFVPQWPYRSIGHNWNVVITESGRSIAFLGAEDSPGTPHRPYTKKGKVYRSGFMLNPECLENIKGASEIPDFLRNPRLFDVTSSYVKTFDINLPVNATNGFAYLSVFDNVDWKPIGWANVQSKRAQFKAFEGDIVYLPTTYAQSKNTPTGDPFLLDKYGKVHTLSPTAHNIPVMRCIQVYGKTPEMYTVEDAKGGQFQGANKVDFSDAVNLMSFSVRALPGKNILKPERKQSFRYFRYLPAKSKLNTVAEIQLYFNNKKLTGKPFGFEGPDSTYRLAFDNDDQTAYSSKKPGSWLGIDLGQAQQVDQITFIAKVDLPKDCRIKVGHEYELRFWEAGAWKPFASQVANDEHLIFEKVPAQALYLLHNRTKKVDERIFTYQDNKQKFY